jgi:nitrogenase molybdenum-iron protein alpha/beta subunit
MSPLRAKAPRSREKRLDTLGAWFGKVSVASKEFAGDEIAQRIRTFAQSSNDDLLYALRILSGIRNSVTIIHGPRGCAAAGLYHTAIGSNTRWIVTDLDERDTIMGADIKLRKSILALYHRYHPSVVFIVGNPVIAINNDDIQSVVEELHEELELPIVPVYVTGFSSQNAVSGYDTALHSLLKYLSGNTSTATKNETLNLLSVAEHPLDRKEAVDLLDIFGHELIIIPDDSAIDVFKSAVAAKASILLSPDAPEYLGVILQEKYDVPLIDVSRPVGVEGTGRWLKSIGAFLGKENVANELHTRKAAETARQIGGFSLKGLKVYISLSSANAFSVLDLVEELGGEVTGLTITHLDRLHIRQLDELTIRTPSLQIHVSDGQAFEEISILRKLLPDLYLGDSTHLGQVARLGIPVVSLESLAFVGYSGVVRLVRRIKSALANGSYELSLAKVNSPYQEAWFRRSHNWHIKQEVK